MASGIRHQASGHRLGEAGMSQRGFTLIEMSVVMTIVALLVAGIVIGKSLIYQYEMRNTVSQFKEFQSAINTFKLKYNCLPGDCANATTFWGRHSSIAQNSCSSITSLEATAWEAADYQTGTCDGDGNNMYNHWTGTEQVVAWQQLSSAGLIKGTYKGARAAGSGASSLQPDIHLPRSDLVRTGNPYGGTPKDNMFAINLNSTGAPLGRFSPWTAANIADIQDTRHVIQLA